MRTVEEWGARRLARGEVAKWSFETTALRGLPPSFELDNVVGEQRHQAFVRHVVKVEALFSSGTRSVEATVAIPMRCDIGAPLHLDPVTDTQVFLNSSVLEQSCCCFDGGIYTLLAAWRVPLPIVLLGEGAPPLIFTAAVAQEEGMTSSIPHVDIVMTIKSEVAEDIFVTWKLDGGIPVRIDAARDKTRKDPAPPPPREPLTLDTARCLSTFFATTTGMPSAAPSFSSVAATVKWEMFFSPVGDQGERLRLEVWATDNVSVFLAAAYATGVARTPDTMRSAARLLLERAVQGQKDRAKLFEGGCVRVLVELLADALNPLDGDAAAAAAASEALECLCRNADADASTRTALADSGLPAAALVWGALADQRTPSDVVLALCSALATLSWEEGDAALKELVACSLALLSAPLPTPQQRAIAASKLLQALPAAAEAAAVAAGAIPALLVVIRSLPTSDTMGHACGALANL